MNIKSLSAETILEEEIFLEVFEESDLINRERIKQELIEQAKSVGVKTRFEALYKVYEKEEKRLLTVEKKTAPPNGFDNNTNFEVDGTDYENLYCGNWIADADGVKTYTMFGECLACYHPILPVERLRNMETRQEKIKLAYYRGFKWREIVVDKDVIASANKIVGLANHGISVTSENAKYLVRYLADVENFNDVIIPTRISTSKMGWIDGEFMPYNSDVIFDGNERFNDTFESIKEHGDFETWLTLVKKIRADGRIEPKISLAASFASVLLKIINALPFFVNLWGITEGGKTVSLMLAASVWADPSENKYIGDFKSTDVAIEVKMDFLNNLPIMLDDTSRVSSKIKDNFEGFIYDLCSGKGKSRSNRSLGINRENNWKNVILTNGEQPLSSDKLQGGAINRILDLHVGAKNIYSDGNAIVKTLQENYGFAGKLFLDIIEDFGKDAIIEMQQSILAEIKDSTKMDKQSMSLSILLTADRLATDFIFKDDQYIDIKEACKQVLVDKETVSDNDRCYEYILSEVAINGSKFRITKEQSDDGLVSNSYGETWGEINEKESVIIIIKNVFDKLCTSGGFSEKSFLAWANTNNLIITQNGKMTKVKKINGTSARCVWVKFKTDENNGFVPASDFNEKLPFLE